MSYNGAGTFLINSPGQPVVAGTTISETVFNSLTADLANGLSTAITKDGQTTATANLPMGGFKLTNLAAGTAATDSARLGQVQSGAATLIAITGTNTVVGTLTPTLTAYAVGQQFSFVAAGTNTTSMTLNINGLGAKAITRSGATALIAGDITVGTMVTVIYDGTRFQTSDARVPISTGVSGLGTGVATALGVAVTGSGSVVLSANPTFTGLLTAGGLTATGSVNLGTSGTGSYLLIRGTDATDALLIYNTAGTKFLAFKPETATSKSTIGYWTGAAWGSVELPGTTQMGAALTYGGVTLANSVTGTGSMVLSASPTLTTMVAVSTNPLQATIAASVPGTGTALAIGFTNDNGAVGTISTSGSSTAYNTSSDYRLKVTYGRADGSIIQRLRVYDAAFISDGARYPMFLAHELQEDGAGFTVYGEKDGPQMQGVDHSKLVPALVAYAQQLRADLDAALARLNAIGA